jgi:CheY-like chemotaxis protein
MKALVVDDNEALVDVIQGVLEDNGLEVIAAKDGLDGYDAYVRFVPDLVITDIHMPKANGLEMMKNIRAHNPMVKTIYMSGDIDSFRPALEKEKSLYTVSILKKPFTMMSLTNLVLDT